MEISIQYIKIDTDNIPEYKVNLSYGTHYSVDIIVKGGKIVFMGPVEDSSWIEETENHNGFYLFWYDPIWNTVGDWYKPEIVRTRIIYDDNTKTFKAVDEESIIKFNWNN